MFAMTHFQYRFLYLLEVEKLHLLVPQAPAKILHHQKDDQGLVSGICKPIQKQNLLQG